MYPFGSTTVSSIINEGIFGIELMKYSDAVHKGKDEKRLRVDEGLFSIFVTAVLNLKQNSSKQYLLNKLLTILGKRNLISIQNNWFGIVCRISLEYESKDELQDFIEGDMSDFMVKGLVQDLHQKVFLFRKKTIENFMDAENSETSLVPEQRRGLFLHRDHQVGDKQPSSAQLARNWEFPGKPGKGNSSRYKIFIQNRFWKIGSASSIGTSS